MKKYSIILLLIVLSCKKEPNDAVPFVNSCVQAQEIKPYLVGKWKLLKWKALHNNLSNCTIAGTNEYDADFWGINAVLELKSNGTVRYFKDDTLRHEMIVSKYTELLYNEGERYDLGCEKLYMRYSRLNIGIDSLHQIQLGDTIMISNPFVDINFTNSVLFSVTYEQHYVKIE